MPLFLPIFANEDVVRALGIFLLSMGIILAVPTVFGLAESAAAGEVAAWVAFAAIVQVPMIAGGIVLIRRVEDREAREVDGMFESPSGENNDGLKEKYGEP